MKPPTCIEDYVRLLDEHEPFALMNFGDGEWDWLLGGEITNCDGFTGTDALTTDLQSMVKFGAAPNLFYGTFKCGNTKPLYQKTAQWVQDFGKPDITWVYKELISNANCQGKLQPMFQHFKNRKTLKIGPEHFRNLENSFVNMNNNPLMCVPLPLGYEFRNRHDIARA